MKQIKVDFLQIAVSLLVAIVSGIDMIGEKARLVHILGIVAGSLGTGIPIGRMAERRRREKAALVTGPTSAKTKEIGGPT